MSSYPLFTVATARTHDGDIVTRLPLSVLTSRDQVVRLIRWANGLPDIAEPPMGRAVSVATSATNEPIEPSGRLAVSSTREMAATRWQRYVSRRFEELERDAVFGTEPGPPLETLSSAWKGVHHLLAPTTATPTVVRSEDRRGVDLVWHKGGWHIEVTFDDGEPTVWARHRATGDQLEGDLVDLRREIADLLAMVSAD